MGLGLGIDNWIGVGNEKEKGHVYRDEQLKQNAATAARLTGVVRECTLHLLWSAQQSYVMSGAVMSAANAEGRMGDGAKGEEASDSRKQQRRQRKQQRQQREGSRKMQVYYVRYTC
jgi:hypothetical protein